MKKLLAYTAVLCLFCSTASAASFGYSVQQCKKKMQENPPQISVVYSYGNLSFDNTKGAEEIEEIFKQINHERPKHKIKGLTTLSPYAQVENNLVAEIVGERLCYLPKQIQISIGYQPTVYISKDLRKNSCRFTLTVRHEQTHLDIGHLSLQKFARRLKKEFAQIVKNIGPIVKSPSDTVTAPDAVAKELNAEYHNQLKVLFDDFVQELLAQNAQIDTEQNYDEERMLCPAD